MGIDVKYTIELSDFKLRFIGIAMLCKITAFKISALLFSFIGFLSGNLLAQKHLNETSSTSVQQNSVKGFPLQTCSLDPLTGFYRDGYCRTSDQDYGSHTVCARMTKEFSA